MRLSGTKYAPLVALVLGLPSFAAADGRSQLEISVERELPRFVQGVDVSSLTHGQVGAIYSTIYGHGNTSEKRLHIRSIIGGRNTLRGLLGIGSRN